MQRGPIVGQLGFLRVTRRGLYRPQLADPVLMVRAARGGQRREYCRQVPVQTGRYRPRMLALGLGTVRHDELGLRSEHLAEAQPEIHRDADDERHVRLAQRFCPRPREGQRMVGGDNAAGHPVHQHRDLPFFGQTQQRGLRVTPPDVGSGHDHRPLRSRKQVGGAVQGVHIRRRWRGQVGKRARAAGILGHRKRVIHREVDESHTRWGGHRCPQGFVDQPARILCGLCGGREAGQRSHKRHMVDLLQRAHSPAQRGSPAAKHHQRRLVLLRGGHCAHAVGDARAGGQRGHPGHPGHL